MKRNETRILVLSLLASSCLSAQPDGNTAAQVKQSSSLQRTVRRKNTKEQTRDLKIQIEQIAQKSGGRVGVAAMVLETGETVSLNANERFPMQSVYKLPIAMAVLSQVDSGKIKLDQKVRIEKGDILKASVVLSSEKYPSGAEQTVEELLRSMVSESDNTASDALLKLAGGSSAVMSYLNTLGVKEIVVANYEKELHADWKAQYNNYATPAAAVELLLALQERRGLSEPSQALLLRFLVESPTGRQRLKGLIPAGTVVAHKTGTSGTRNGVTAATNDIGIITLSNGRHLAVAVFVSDSSADQTTRERIIAEIAHAAWKNWSEK